MSSPDEQPSLREAVSSVPSQGAAKSSVTGARPVLWLAVLTSAVAGALVASSLTRVALPGATPDAPLTRDVVANRLREPAALSKAALQRQLQALRAAAQPAYLRTWDSASQHRAATIFANLESLGATVSSTRYVGADVGGVSLQQQRLGGSSWTADVQLSWRLRGFDRRDAQATLTYTFVQRAAKAYVVDIAAASGAQSPIWLLGQLEVSRTERTLVAAATSREAARIGRQLRRAAVDVASVVSGWRGTLVAYVPATVAKMEAVLGEPPGAYSDIAAVTTTVDGSRQPHAPVAIVLNPAVFSRLGKLGAQVVITHESTHAATGAAPADLPLWLAEGFADYVGVGSADVPLSVSARAVVRDIRHHGLPDALPSNAAFGSPQGHSEVYYEQAWLAARVISRDYGQNRLVAFYERVAAHPDSFRRALHTILHTTLPALTATWRSYLRAVAGAV